MVHVAPAATVIADDAQALAAARTLAARFAEGAAARDAERRLPLSELDELSDSGLLGITVPREHGGADVSIRTLTEVFRLLAWADPSIAQIPQSHFVYVNALHENGTDQQKRRFYAELLNGRRIGNAQAESGRTALDVDTRLERAPGGGYTLSGTKKYATGALTAHIVGVLAKDPDDRLVIAYVPADDPGVQIIDDWDGLGQRTTGSGTVRLTNVSVPAEDVVEHHRTFERPQLHGALAQILHAAIDAGIARASLDDARQFVQTKARPWKDADVERAADDPLTVQQFGELEVQVRSVEALLAIAADAIDQAKRAGQGADDLVTGRASIAVATAKVSAARAAVDVSSALFELGGTSAALASRNLDRHWRNARTHSLHDPVRWKVQHIGRYALSGTLPPRTGQL